MTEHLETSSPPGGQPLSLWAGVLGSPVLWSLHLQANYALVHQFCHHGGMIWMHVITAVLLAGVVACGVVSWREWKGAGYGSPESPEGGPGARTQFLGALGVLVSGMFALAVIAQGIATFLFAPCWY